MNPQISGADGGDEGQDKHNARAEDLFLREDRGDADEQPDAEFRHPPVFTHRGLFQPGKPSE